MNAVTTTRTTTNGSPVSAVEFVRSLPPEEKQAVFLALLREAIQLNGDTGLLPIEDEDGNPFGCYLPPKAIAARAEALLPKMSQEREAELAKRQNEPNRMLTTDELREWLKQATPAQSQ
jgi:hypothetical protein